MGGERLVRERGTWEVVRADFDWDTTCRWKQLGTEPGPKPKKDSRLEAFRFAPAPRIARPDPYQVTITWQTDAQTSAGTYRIVHYGRFKKDGKVERFVATSRPFQASR